MIWNATKFDCDCDSDNISNYYFWNKLRDRKDLTEEETLLLVLIALHDTDRYVAATYLSEVSDLQELERRKKEGIKHWKEYTISYDFFNEKPYKENIRKNEKMLESFLNKCKELAKEYKEEYNKNRRLAEVVRNKLIYEMEVSNIEEGREFWFANKNWDEIEDWKILFFNLSELSLFTINMKNEYFKSMVLDEVERIITLSNAHKNFKLENVGIRRDI